jgi:hypothetical protein
MFLHLHVTIHAVRGVLLHFFDRVPTFFDLSRPRQACHYTKIIQILRLLHCPGRERPPPAGLPMLCMSTGGQ